jgi:hypothetical protein
VIAFLFGSAVGALAVLGCLNRDKVKAIIASFKTPKA